MTQTTTVAANTGPIAFTFGTVAALGPAMSIGFTVCSRVTAVSIAGIAATSVRTGTVARTSVCNDQAAGPAAATIAARTIALVTTSTVSFQTSPVHTALGANDAIQSAMTIVTADLADLVITVLTSFAADTARLSALADLFGRDTYLVDAATLPSVGAGARPAFERQFVDTSRTNKSDRQAC